MNEIREGLESFYSDRGLAFGELNTLILDYAAIDKFWQKQFEQIEDVRLVLLGEAPLFGQKQSYFYNPAIGATVFFGYKHYSDIAGDRFGLWKENRNATVLEKKCWLLSKMRDAGIIVLDMFPLPLNKNTLFNYASLSDHDYKSLFQTTIQHHLVPKLNQLKSKSLPNTQFVFRYARLRNRVGPSFERAFEMGGSDKHQIYSGHVGASYGNLNTPLLRSIYESSFA